MPTPVPLARGYGGVGGEAPWRGLGAFSRRLKSAFFGLRPEVGLRRPSLNGGNEEDGRGLIPSRGLGCAPIFQPMKSAFLGLRSEVGLRRPSLNGGDEEDGRGLIPSRGLGVRPHLSADEIGLFWPSVRGRPAPTFVKRG